MVHAVPLDGGGQRLRVRLVLELRRVHADDDEHVGVLLLQRPQLVEHVQAVDAAERPEVEPRVYVIWLATIAWNIQAPLRAHLDFPRDWSLPLLVLTVYLYSRGLADDLGFVSVHVTAPIEVDRAMFGGTLPTEWLQGQLCGDPCLRSAQPHWYDVILRRSTTALRGGALHRRGAVAAQPARLGAVHAPLPVAQHPGPGRLHHLPDGAAVAGVAGRLHHRRHLADHRPGLARPAGRQLPPEAVRGRQPGGRDALAARRYRAARRGLRHPRLRGAARWLLLLYPAAMSFMLVYYAEHYVVDILAGFAAAGLVLWGCAGGAAPTRATGCCARRGFPARGRQSMMWPMASPSGEPRGMRPRNPRPRRRLHRDGVLHAVATRTTRPAGAFGTRGSAAPASSTSFNEDHILATTQGTIEYRSRAGVRRRPLFMGVDTHALSSKPGDSPWRCSPRTRLHSCGPPPTATRPPP